MPLLLLLALAGLAAAVAARRTSASDAATSTGLPSGWTKPKGFPSGPLPGCPPLPDAGVSALPASAQNPIVALLASGSPDVLDVLAQQLIACGQLRAAAEVQLVSSKKRFETLNPATSIVPSKGLVASATSSAPAPIFTPEKPVLTPTGALNITNPSTWCPAAGSPDEGLAALPAAIQNLIAFNTRDDKDGSIRRYIAGALRACGQNKAASELGG